MWMGVLAAALLGLGTASAQDPLLHEEVLGGLAIDASGVTTDDTASWFAGDDLILTVPAGAVLDRGWLLLFADGDGFTDDPLAQVRFNGADVGAAATLAESSERTRAYGLDLGQAGLVAGANTYEEVSGADGTAGGLAGSVVAVTWTHAALAGSRFVSLGTAEVYDDALTLLDTPTRGTFEEIVASFAVVDSCADDQDASAWVDTSLAASYAGGRDDGDRVTTACADAPTGANLTAGSFGFDDSDTVVGVDGDSPDSEPGGDSRDSRRSDELWRVRHVESGEIELRFGGTGGGGWLGAYALVIELDADEDGVPDASDNCVLDENSDQLDTDGDGLGNECDVCIDQDGDGHGIDGPSTCATDCDDDDPDANPDQAEDWYDGVDQDCSGGSDFDADGDGDTITGAGGTDCDDTDASVSGTLAEVCDGQDNDCDGLADDDDDDTEGGDTWYVDQDGDGWGTDPVQACEQPDDTAVVGGDCDDTDDDVQPFGREVCDINDTDEDCDGLADDDDPSADDTLAWYEDRDRDGWGDPDSEVVVCDPPSGWILQGGDCDDRDADIYPGAPGWLETCEPEPRNEIREDDDVCGCTAGRGGGWWVLGLVAMGWRRRDTAGQQRCR